MARSIEEIKAGMTSAWMDQGAVRRAYGFDGRRSFGDCFSAASLENVIFYVFAFAVRVLEELFDMHREEVDGRIAELEPHTLRWYVGKAKNYMHGCRLVRDSDSYDTGKMTESEIESARVVRYAVATESNTVVYLKVARRGPDGNPAELTDGQLRGFQSYINEVKDAGVAVEVRNEPADLMELSLTVFYDPRLLRVEEGHGVLSDGSDPVRDAVQAVVTGLPFDGVFRKGDLLSALEALDCVEVAEVNEIRVRASNGTEWSTVCGFSRPYSGYYRVAGLQVDYEPFEGRE